MMTGNPVPGTYLSSWNRPLQTPVAPCHSWKSETRTGVPALLFHHCGVGNFVYWIVSRISPVNLYGGGRIWPATRPPRPARDATRPAPTPIWTHSRRVMPFSFSSFSQLTAHLNGTPEAGRPLGVGSYESTPPAWNLFDGAPARPAGGGRPVPARAAGR